MSMHNVSLEDIVDPLKLSQVAGFSPNLGSVLTAIIAALHELVVKANRLEHTLEMKDQDSESRNNELKNVTQLAKELRQTQKDVRAVREDVGHMKSREEDTKKQIVTLEKRIGELSSNASNQKVQQLQDEINAFKDNMLKAVETVTASVDHLKDANLNAGKTGVDILELKEGLKQTKDKLDKNIVQHKMFAKTTNDRLEKVERSCVNNAQHVLQLQQRMDELPRVFADAEYVDQRFADLTRDTATLARKASGKQRSGSLTTLARPTSATRG
eukprot:Colp12_sorted_trinity150504_noHs@13962